MKKFTHRFPAIKMHAGELAKIWFCDVNVETLALIDVRSSISGHLDNILLRNLPYSPI